jgi:hypothetical protein
MSDPNRQEVLTRLTEAYARADKAEAELAKRDKALEQITRILASSSDAFGVGESRDPKLTRKAVKILLSEFFDEKGVVELFPELAEWLKQRR